MVVATAVEVATSVLRAVVVMGTRGGTGGIVVEVEAGVAASFSSVSLSASDTLVSAFSFYQGVSRSCEASRKRRARKKGKNENEKRKKTMYKKLYMQRSRRTGNTYLLLCFCPIGLFRLFRFTLYSKVSKVGRAVPANVPLPSPS